MKRILFITAILFSGALYSQSSVEESADKLFDKYNYGEALGLYQLAYEDDTADVKIVRRMGICLRKIGQTAESAEWFLKAIRLGCDIPEDKLHYAEALKARRDYSKAVFWYSRYAKGAPEDRRAQLHIRDTRYFADLYADSLKYDVKALEINSDKPSFGMCRFNDQYVFCSAGIRQTDLDQEAFDEVPYLDVFSCHLNANGEAVDAERLTGDVNSRYHDGPAFFDPNNQVMYVTRNNIKRGRPVYDESGTANLQIYAIRLENGKWQKAEGLDFNSDAYSTGHPTLDLVSTRMVFVSNMPGGYGGTDLYEVRYTSEGWTPPRNLGPTINTEGNEMFPFISDQGELLYSSDGHAGLGGLDIFKATLVKDRFSDPVNLGYPINSSGDDFGIHWNEEEPYGYFSSNRETGLDKIYKFSKVRIVQQIVAVSFETDEAVSLAGKPVTFRSGDGTEQVMRLNAEQSLEVVAKAGESFELFFGEPAATSADALCSFDAADELEETYIDLGTVEVLRAALEEAGIIEPVIEEILTELPDSSATDDGDALIAMLERLRDETHYLSQSEFEDFTESQLMDDSELSTLVMSQDDNVRERNDELRTFELNNIYFGFDSYRLSAAAKDQLTALHEMLTDDESLQMVIKAHTDSRGNEDYNLLLSMRRAKSVEKALTEMGVSPQRFRIAWVGEKELYVNCEEQDCDESDHALNRRVEVVFVNGNTAFNR